MVNQKQSNSTESTTKKGKQQSCYKTRINISLAYLEMVIFKKKFKFLSGGFFPTHQIRYFYLCTHVTL